MNHDLVYILGKGSRWGDNEIRFSLRSVEKFMPHRQVFVIGEKPAWMKNVVHIPMEDQYDHKLRNGVAKIEAAALDDRISDTFILMNDDFFILKPVEQIKVWHRGPLSKTIKNHVSHVGYYYTALCQTAEILEELGIKEPTDFEVHFPVAFEKKKLVEVLYKVRKYVPQGILIRTLYWNLFKVAGEFKADIKVNITKLLLAYIKKLDLDMFSTTDSVVLSTNFQKWISERFPEPSKFESDGGEGVRIWHSETRNGPRFTTDKQFFWLGRTYNPGDIITRFIPESIRKEHGIRDLNAES